MANFQPKGETGTNVKSAGKAPNVEPPRDATDAAKQEADANLARAKATAGPNARANLNGGS